MKKKILISALGLASVFAMTSSTDGETAQTDRKFWGREDIKVVNCVKSGNNPDGSPTYSVTVEQEYYVFWIGVSTTHHTYNGQSSCSIPNGCISC